MEKECKLVENMKTNGLNMNNYWIVNGVYNFCSYAATAFFYFAGGRYMLGLDFFEDTNAWLLLQVFTVWGLS